MGALNQCSYSFNEETKTGKQLAERKSLRETSILLHQYFPVLVVLFLNYGTLLSQAFVTAWSSYACPNITILTKLEYLMWLAGGILL